MSLSLSYHPVSLGVCHFSKATLHLYLKFVLKRSKKYSLVTKVLKSYHVYFMDMQYYVKSVDVIFDVDISYFSNSTT